MCIEIYISSEIFKWAWAGRISYWYSGLEKQRLVQQFLNGRLCIAKIELFLEKVNIC